MKIRELLDALDDLDADAIDRLCDLREIRQRSRTAKCESLARSYKGDFVAFFEDLRKQDLVALLADPTEIEGYDYYLPSATKYSKDQLIAIARYAFEHEGIPGEFEIADIDVEAEDDEETNSFRSRNHLPPHANVGTAPRRAQAGARASMPHKELAHPHVFVSYSHQDDTWRKRLAVHLQPLVRNGEIDLWDDTKIQPGNEWRKEIEQALSAASVAVLLISADFLASEFISNKEIPPLLHKASTRGTEIISLIVGPSLYRRHPELSRFQAVNPPDRPLSGLTSHEADAMLVKVAERIMDLAGITP